MDPALSRRVAWALNGADFLTREARDEAASATEAASAFEELPAWLRGIVLGKEALRDSAAAARPTRDSGAR